MDRIGEDDCHLPATKQDCIRQSLQSSLGKAVQDDPGNLVGKGCSQNGSSTQRVLGVDCQAMLGSGAGHHPARCPTPKDFGLPSLGSSSFHQGHHDREIHRMRRNAETSSNSRSALRLHESHPHAGVWQQDFSVSAPSLGLLCLFVMEDPHSIPCTDLHVLTYFNLFHVYI